MEIKENNIEKSLVKKSENSLNNRNVNMIKHNFNRTITILFYMASFIVSMAASAIFIFTIVDV